MLPYARTLVSINYENVYVGNILCSLAVGSLRIYFICVALFRNNFRLKNYTTLAPMQCQPDNSLFVSVTHNLFLEIESMYKKEGKLSDAALLALHAAFGAPCERALELLEKDCVTLLTTADDSRQALQVCGTRKDMYTIFPNINFCPCPAFSHQVVTTRVHVTCKHVLAAKLSQITGRTLRKEASAQEVARILYSTCAAFTENANSLPT